MSTSVKRSLDLAPLWLFYQLIPISGEAADARGRGDGHGNLGLLRHTARGQPLRVALHCQRTWGYRLWGRVTRIWQDINDTRAVGWAVIVLFSYFLWLFSVPVLNHGRSQTESELLIPDRILRFGLRNRKRNILLVNKCRYIVMGIRQWHSISAITSYGFFVSRRILRRRGQRQFRKNTSSYDKKLKESARDPAPPSEQTRARKLN